MPSFKQRLKKPVRRTQITSLAAINNLLWIRSGPVALRVLRVLMISFTSNTVSLMSFISQLRNVTCGSGLHTFSRVACLMKYSLSAFAFSLFVQRIVPFSHSGGISSEPIPFFRRIELTNFHQSLLPKHSGLDIFSVSLSKYSILCFLILTDAIEICLKCRVNVLMDYPKNPS